MRKILLASAVAVLAVIGGVAVAQPGMDGPGRGGMFERMDENNDGRVTRAEFDAGHAGMFIRLDANRDGAITAEEMDSGRPDRGERHGRHGEHRNPDANNDGVVTREEFLAGPVSAFARFDANGDGRLTGEEIPRRGR